MQKIKVSEIFGPVIQGEGRYVGVPSVFLRMFGCNLSCLGFGMPAGQLTNEINIIASDLGKYGSYEELPLSSTGCDSYPASDSRFKKLSKNYTLDELAQAIVDRLPDQKWQGEHLVITGGEPLLKGWQKIYPELLSHSLIDACSEVTFETNGTQELVPEFARYLFSNFNHETLTFSVSPKLSCSGESRDDAIKPEIVASYEKLGFTYLKFVVASEDDVQEAMQVTKLYRKAGFEGPVYLMPVGGTVETYMLSNQQVANLALKYRVRYSPRLHVDLFGNSWGT